MNQAVTPVLSVKSPSIKTKIYIEKEIPQKRLKNQQKYMIFYKMEPY